MGRGLSRQVRPEPPPTDAPPTQAPPRAPLGTALVTWLRNAWTRRPHFRHVGPENTEEVPVALPSSSEPQGTCAEEPSLRTCFIQVLPAFEFLGREDLPLESSSLVAICETSESSFISERIPTPPQKELPRELGSKDVGVPSELLVQEGAAQDLENESVDEPPEKTSRDPEEATLADIPSLEDEVWDPLPSSSSSLGHEEGEDLALKPRRWSSMDLEQVRPRVPPTRPGTTTEEASSNAFLRTQRGASCIDLPGGSPSSAEVMRAVDYVARKHLKMATDHYLESNGRECGELMCAVLNSPYCSAEAALDLFLAKVKEGPWLAEEGKEQGSSTLDAATARATRAIGKIVRYIKDSSRLQGWFLELLLALVTNYIEVTRPGLEAPSRDQSSIYVPPE
ncbi:uncharacterized protein [Anolis sagrei]|uniref:uncharacterized protein n=1 Tax=Anolis sagrei TaxID=38937 RepID=UPI003521BBF5